MKNTPPEMGPDIFLKTGVPSETALRVLVIGDPAKNSLPFSFRRLRGLAVDLKFFPLTAHGFSKIPAYGEYLYYAPVANLKRVSLRQHPRKILRNLWYVATGIFGFPKNGAARESRLYFAMVFQALKIKFLNILKTHRAQSAREYLAWLIGDWRPGTILCLPEARGPFFQVWNTLSEEKYSISDWTLRSLPGGEAAVHRDVANHPSLHRLLGEMIETLETEPAPASGISVGHEEDFADDPYPGNPKILFVGEVLSAHAHAWIRLFDEERINVRFFSHHIGVPPKNFQCRTYVTSEPARPDNPLTRSPKAAAFKKARETTIVQGEPAGERKMTEAYLARVIDRWRPDIIDTIGMRPAGEHLYNVRNAHPEAASIGRWVLQVRQSDLVFADRDPGRDHLVEMLEDADIILSDNLAIRSLITEAGCRTETLEKFYHFPATGGIDVDHALTQWQGPPSERRLILWPKCYESPWARALPVLQALKIAWPDIQPARVVALMTSFDMTRELRHLPRRMQSAFTVMVQIPQPDVLSIMARARLMVAPSLVDGLPLSTVEAMASGAVPLVSPLPSLAPVFKDDGHVLFADNENPEDIARQMVRAMTDDALVDRIAATNREYGREIADRAVYGPRIVDFYKALLDRPRENE